MRKRPTEPTAPDIGTLEMMLDYAIVAGAELRLPVFVLLLRAARFELMSHFRAAPDLSGTAASETGAPVMLDARPDGRTPFLQDR